MEKTSIKFETELLPKSAKWLKALSECTGFNPSEIVNVAIYALFQSEFWHIAESTPQEKSARKAEYYRILSNLSQDKPYFWKEK